MRLDDYLGSVEARAESRYSPMEPSIERDTLQRGISDFENKHGPFDEVLVEDHGYGWKLIGRRQRHSDVYAAVPRPLTARKLP